MFIILILVATSPVGAAGSTKTLRDNATGGDCTSIGTWDMATKTCMLTGDFTGTIGIVNDGITLDGAGDTLNGYRLNGSVVFNTSGVTVKNLNIVGFGNGVLISGGSGNTITCNTIAGSDIGVYIEASDGNTIAYNTLGGNAPMDGNGTGVSIVDSANNAVSNNKFLANAVQAKVSPAGGNTFSENYFNDFDTPAEGCNDVNGDGFCDAAYAFMGGSDATPRTTAATCGQPDLRLYKDGVRWVTYAAFVAGNLSVDYSVHNVSGWLAYNVKITGSTGDHGVTLNSTVPVSLGNIAGAGTAVFTLEYHVPSGVGGFITNTTGTAENACGVIYNYP